LGAHRDIRGAEERSDGRFILFILEQSPTLAPILRFFNAEVTAIEIQRAGQLTIRFVDDSLIEVEPNEAYEAWQVGISSRQGDYLLVCAPGGEIVLFQEPDTAPGIEGAKLS
jgi:hypothetical protein